MNITKLTKNQLIEQYKLVEAKMKAKEEELVNLTNRTAELEAENKENKEAMHKYCTELQEERRRVVNLREDATGMDNCIVDLKKRNSKLKVKANIYKGAAIVLLVGFLICIGIILS